MPHLLPPSLASAVAACDTDGLLALLETLDAQRAAVEQQVLRSLLQHEAVEVARAAARACCRLRVQAVVPQLHAILVDPESISGPDVLAGIEGWLLPDWIDAYRRLLEIEDYPWKAQILQNLSLHGSGDAARLLAAWVNRPEPELAVPALIGLRKFPSMAHYRLAREALENPSREVAIEATRTVVAVGGKTALREQLRWARSAPRELQAETLALARKHGDATLGLELEPWLLHPDDTLVLDAVATIRAIAATPSARALDGCFGSSDPIVRSEALRCANLLPAREAVDLLERGLADAVPSVQHAAVESLAGLGVPKAVDLLLRAISLPAASTRALALRVLFRLEREEAPQLARQLLTDSSAEVRKEALRLLTKAGEPPDPERLQALLTDNDSNVREEARQLALAVGPEPDEAARLAAAGYGAQAASLLVGDMVERNDDERPVFQLGILLFGRGNHEAALEKFLRVLELNPAHEGALRYLAWTYEQLGNPQAQLEAARRLSDLAPGETWAQRLAGLDAARAGRHAEACERLDRVAAVEADDIEVAFHLGAAHFSLGSLDAARKLLEKSVNDSAHARASTAMLAEIALKQRRLKDAEELLTRVVAAGGEPDAACKLATLMLESNRPAEAVRILQPLVRSRTAPPNSAWLIGAQAALALDRAADAVTWIDRAAPLESNDVLRRTVRAEALRRVGRYGDARLEYEAALEAGADVAFPLAVCLDVLGDTFAALDALAKHTHAHGRNDPQVRLLEGRLLRRAGRLAEAQEALDPLAAWETPDPEYHHELARCHLAAGAAGPALRAARHYQEAMPGSAEAALLLGEALLEAGDVENARRQLQDLCARPNAAPRTRRLLVSALSRLGEPDRVLEAAAPILTEYRDDASFCEEVGAAHHARRQLGIAREWLGRAARLVTPGRALLTRLAELDLEIGDARSALAHAAALSEMLPDDAVAQRLHGLALISADRAAEAIPYLRRACERAPDDARVRSSLAVALHRIGDVVSVLALYPDAVLLEAATEEAAIAVAESHERRGQRKTALDMLENRAQRGRLGSKGLRLFAALCVADNDIVRAEGLLNTALRANGDDVLLLEARAELMLRRGRPRAAEQDLQKALAADPDRAPVLLLLAELKLTLGAHKEAGTLLQRYTRAVPANAAGFKLLARCWLEQEQLERAEKALRAALDLDPQDAKIAGDLIVLLLRTGRKEDARTLLGEYTSGKPERVQALCARAALLDAEGRAIEQRWLRRELAALEAPVQMALLPLVMELACAGKDREAWAVILEFGQRQPDAMPVLGTELAAAGRHDLAREVYRRSFEVNGRSVSDLVGVAKCQLALGDGERAAALLRDVRARCPGHVEASFLLAKLTVAASPAEARPALEKVLELEPNHIPALELSIELDLKEGKLDAAAATVQSCLERDFGRAEFHLLKAAVARARGQMDDAQDALMWAAGLDPSNERASCEAAELLIQRRETAAARDVLARLLSASPDSRRGRLAMSKLMAAEGDLNGMLREWHETEKRHRLSPEETAAFVEALWAVGEDEEAARRVNRLRLEQPDSALSWMLAGRTAQRQQNLPAAIEFYAEVVKRQEGSVEAHTALAECHQKLGRPLSAIPHARRALELDRFSREAQWRLANLLQSQGHDAEALAILEELIWDPGDHAGEARLLAGRLALRLKNRPRAIELLAAEPMPSAELLELLGDLYYEDSSWLCAADAYGRLAAMGAAADPARVRRRAEACLQAGRLTDALGSVRELLNLEAATAPERATGRIALELARELARRSRPDEALGLLRVLVTRPETDKPGLHLEIAAIHEAAGRRQALEEALRQALEAAPGDARVLDAVASFHAADESFERLRERMAQSTRLEPGSFKAWLYLGAALCRTGSPSAGQNACARAVRLSPRDTQGWLGLARAARQAGDVETSVAAYRKTLEIESEHPTALIELVDVYDAAGLNALAAEHCRKLLATSQDARLLKKARAVLARATSSPARPAPGPGTEEAMAEAMRRSRWAEARAYAESLLRMKPRHLEALSTVAEVALRTGDLEAAQQAAAAALEHHPGSLDVRVTAGRVARARGDMSAARAEAFRAVEIDPGHPDAALLLAELLAADGQDAAAEAAVRRAIEVSPPGEERLRTSLAQLLERRGDIPGAIKALAEPVVQTTEGLIELGRLLTAANDWERSLEVHSRLLALAPLDGRAPMSDLASRAAASEQRTIACLAARALVDTGEPPLELCRSLAASAPASAEPALASLLEALLEKLPASVPTRERTGLALMLARQYRLAGKQQAAQERLSWALELDPASVDAQDQLAGIFLETKRVQPMEAAFGRIASRVPDSARAWVHLACARIALKRPLPAQEAAARAVALDPGDFDASLALARACRLTSDWERSIASYRQALRIKPNDPRVLYELATAYGASGLEELAHGQWRRLLKVVPEGSELAATAWGFIRKREA